MSRTQKKGLKQSMASSRKSMFPHVCFVVFLCSMLLGLASLALLWNYLAEYEKSTPQYAAEKLLALYRTGDYSAAMKQVGIDPESFYDDTQYAGYVQAALGDLETVRIVDSGEHDGKKQLSLRGESGNSLRFTLVNGTQRLRYGLKSIGLRQEPVPTASITVRAPSHAVVTVNGKKLDAAQKKAGDTVSALFPALRDSASMPTESVYELAGFAVKPQLALEGKTAEESHLEVTDQTATFTMLLAGQEKESREALAAEVSKVYAKYISHDAQLSDVTQYLYPDTDFYEVVRSFSNEWYSSHSGVDFKDLTVSNTMEYSPDHFSSEISFDYIVYRGSASKHSQEWQYPTKYRIFFMRVNEQWKVVEIDLL